MSKKETTMLGICYRWMKTSALVGAVGIVLVVVGVGHQQAGVASADSAAEQLGQRWCAAWNSHDLDRVAAVFTSDVFYEDVTFGVTAHGSGELRDLAQFFFTAVPDFHLECPTTLLRGGHGSIEWVFSG